MDLSLVPLRALCDEICNRAKTAVVFVHIDDPDTTLNGYWNWKGDYYSALGLCEEMKYKIQHQDDNGL